MSYHKHFDHLGQLRAGDYNKFTRAEKTVAVLFFVFILLCSTGVIK
jgi:hypothetical protein